MGPLILILVSTGHFEPLIREAARLAPTYSFYGQIGSTPFEPPFPFVRTAPPERIEALIDEAELVVSHAGTGMLSMLYRRKKKAVCIPKQIRYGEANDGQVELARKWGELGLCELCLDVKELAPAIERCRKRSFEFRSFPSLGKHFAEKFGLNAKAEEDPASLSA